MKTIKAFFKKMIKVWRRGIFHLAFVIHSLKCHFKRNLLVKVGVFVVVALFEAVLGIISLPFYLIFNHKKVHLLAEGIKPEKALVYRPHYVLRRKASVMACVFVAVACLAVAEVDHLSKIDDSGDIKGETYAVLNQKSIAQATDGSGYLSFEAAVGFLNVDKQSLKIEYSDDGGKNFYQPKLISVKSNIEELILKESGGVVDFSGVDISGKVVVLNFVWDTKSKENGNGGLAGVYNCEMNLQLTLVEKSIVEEVPVPAPGVLEPVREEIPAEEMEETEGKKEEELAEVLDVFEKEKTAESSLKEEPSLEEKGVVVEAALPEGVGGPDDLAEIADAPIDVVSAGNFCLDNQNPSLVSSELTYASNSIKIIFNEAMAIENEIDFSKLIITSHGPENKSYGLAGSTPVWQDATTLTVSLSDEARDYLHSGAGAWVSSEEVFFETEGESGLTDIFGNPANGLSAGDSVKMSVVTEGYGTELPPPTVQEEPKKDEKVATPSDEPPPKEIVRNSQENSCKVSPSTQIFKQGGIGYYTVHVTSANPNSTFKLLTGRLPAGVTLKFNKASGKGDENINFSVLLPEDMRTGLFKGVIVDDFKNPDGQTGQSFCLFNIRVE